MAYYFLGLILVFLSILMSQGTMFDNPPACNDLYQQISLEDDNRFLFVGESANLTCSIYTGNQDNISAENFYFKVKKNNTNHIPQSSMKKNSTHVEISTSDLIEDIPENPFFDYVCLFNDTVAGAECVNRKYIYFDFRPAPVESFYCLVQNWSKMTCWCDLGVTYKERHLNKHIEVNITVYVGIAALSLDPLSPENVKQNGSCLKMIIPEENFNLAMYKVQIEIQNTARNVKVVSGPYVFEPAIYVKPDEIKDFSHSQNATYIQLGWHHSNDVMPKVFCVKYREKDSNDTWKKEAYTHTSAKSEIYEILNKSLAQQMMKALNSLPDTTSYSMLLSKLWPYTNYTITVGVRPLIENDKDSWIQTGYWSDSIEYMIQTKEDVPIAVPKLEPGYFSQIDDDIIEIYWKPIDKREKCGNIQSYRVIMQEVVPFGEIENSTKENFPPDRISHQIQLDPSKKYNIKLTQRTSVGYPIEDDAHIYVFPKDYRPKVPSFFQVAAYNDTQVELKWEPASLDQVNKEIKELSVYQIVWCRSSLLDKCLEPMESINETTTNVNISFNKGHFSQYKFGISAVSVTQKGWFVSSGITWYKDCIYFLDGIPEIPLNLNIPLDVDQEDGLYIKWTPYSCQQSVGRVDTYVVYFCETDGEGTGCKGQEDKEVVPSSSTSYRIKNLIEGNIYLVKIAAKMRNGQLGNWSNVERVLVGKENSILLEAVLGGVGGGVVIFIIIIAVVILRGYCEEANADAQEIHPPRIQRTPFSNIDANGSSSETKELRPLLKSNHSATDSGLGGSTFNGHNTELSSLDKKNCMQNGVSGQNMKGHLLQNGSINQSTIISESPCVSTTNDNLNSETTFTITGILSDSNSGQYTDVDMHDSDDDDESSLPDSFFEKMPQKSMILNSIHGENKGFLNENVEEKKIDSSCIESYCKQGESSIPIDSYCVQGFDSSSGVNIT